MHGVRPPPSIPPTGPTTPGTLSPGLVVFSPLPPKPNGIADYCLELLRPLSRHYDCVVVVEDGATDAVAPEGVAVIQLVEYCARHESFCDRMHLYQVGNNRDTLYMLPIMAVRPGLVVLHDPALHYLIDVATNEAGGAAAYEAALEAEYGGPGRMLGAQFARWQLRSQRMYFDLPMLRMLLGPQRGVIVHSRFAAAKVLAQLPDAAVTRVPHQYSPPDDRQITPREDARRALGVAPGEILFMSLGFVTRAKLIDRALRALAAIRDRLPPFRYVIAGELQPDEIDIPALVDQLGLGDRVILPGYVAEEAFFSLIGAADVVINLRFPVGGETSGTMVRALGAGACLVVVARGAFAEIADEAAVKLPWGPGFDARLAEALLDLARDPDRRARIGTAARATTVARNALTVTVAGYRAALDRAAAAPPRAWATTAVWEYLPVRELARLTALAGEAVPPLWFRAGALPTCATPCRMLAAGLAAADRALLAHALGHAPEHVDLAHHVAAPRSIDLLLLQATAADLPAAPAALFVRLNAMLAFGGVLVVGVARAAQDGPRHPVEEREAGGALFEACGFRVDLTTAAAPPLLRAGVADDAGATGMVEERCWRLVKVSEFLTSTARAAVRAAPAEAALA